MGVVTTVLETAFNHPREKVYDFVTDPSNWPKTYPGSEHFEGHGLTFPLKVGDSWTETGPKGEKYTWHVAIAMRPTLWMSNTVGRIGHDGKGGGGMEGRITAQYHFTQPGGGITLFTRTLTVEAYRGITQPDAIFASLNPVYAEQYHAAIARELGS